MGTLPPKTPRETPCILHHWHTKILAGNLHLGRLASSQTNPSLLLAASRHMVFPLLWFWPPHVAHISHRSASTITSFRTTRRAQPIQRAQFPLSCARGMSYTPTSRLAGAEDTTPVLLGAMKKWGINEEEYTQRVQRHRLVVRSPSWITEILNFGLFFSQFSLVFKKTSGRWRSGTPGIRRGRQVGLHQPPLSLTLALK